MVQSNVNDSLLRVQKHTIALYWCNILVHLVKIVIKYQTITDQSTIDRIAH